MPCMGCGGGCSACTGCKNCTSTCTGECKEKSNVEPKYQDEWNTDIDTIIVNSNGSTTTLKATKHPGTEQ